MEHRITMDQPEKLPNIVTTKNCFGLVFKNTKKVPLDWF